MEKKEKEYLCDLIMFTSSLMIIFFFAMLNANELSETWLGIVITVIFISIPLIGICVSAYNFINYKKEKSDGDKHNN